MTRPPATPHAPARALAILLSAVALTACAASKDFVQPSAAPQPSVGEQVQQAKQLAAKAQRAEAAKKNDEAIALYKQAIEAYRDFPLAWHNLGVLQLETGDTLAAVESFKVAADLEPRDPLPPYNIGVIYQNHNWPQDAQRYYTEALSRDPNFLLALEHSVELDMDRATYSAATLDRTRRGLMLEKNPVWRGFFERSLLHLESALKEPESSATPLTAPGSQQNRP